jgi:hypothetical protein
MISHGWLFRLNDFPTTFKPPLNRRCHSASLITATRRPPGPASMSVGKSRPRAT